MAAPVELELTHWVVEGGGSADVTVGEVPGAPGLRGVLAARAFTQGEAVISLPVRLAVGLGLHTFTPQELAARLLRRRHAKRSWAAELDAFWSSLPPLPWSAPDMLPPLSGIGIDLTEFGHWAALCASYSHVFPMAGSAPGRFLLPLLHLVNHDGLAPNIAVEKDAAAGAFKGIALRDIAAGEQVTYRYNWGILRPDVALANYFFIQPMDPPLRCALDLPTAQMEVEFEDADDLQYLPRTAPEAQAEARRLGELLAASPTTLAQDEALLDAGLDDAGGQADWQTRRILEYRVQRKRALRWTIARLLKRRPHDRRRMGHLGMPQKNIIS
ncbi:hypothetical protein WJX81_002633 [Elliptochloris bilobata]|uniref:SET domain-containing protein n=1 Tax=Elliptochloris bilobata TaxID=381761 RepID=A0AAW1QLJ7_9CHLO